MKMIITVDQQNNYIVHAMIHIAVIALIEVHQPSITLIISMMFIMELLKKKTNTSVNDFGRLNTGTDVKPRFPQPETSTDSTSALVYPSKLKDNQNNNADFYLAIPKQESGYQKQISTPSYAI